MTLTIFLICGLATAVALGVLFPRLFRRTQSGVDNPLDWLQEFSAARYRPMERLLDSSDYKFLAAQPGFKRSIARRLRRERISLFQTYLRNMIRDFHRLLRIARWVIVFSSSDQSAFASELWRLRLRFYRSVVGVEFGLLLSVVGAGSTDARRLLASLENVRTLTIQLLPKFEPA